MPRLVKVLWPGFGSRLQVTWPNAERDVQQHLHASRLQPTEAVGPQGQALTEQLGAFSSLCSQISHCGASRATGRPLELVGRILLACSLENVSSGGCKYSRLQVSSAGVQWPQWKTNENVFSHAFHVKLA